MATSPAPRAAGALLAFAILAGAVIGVALGQPTLGVLGGAAAGSAVALLLWLRDRR
jgi:hypothetical protein